MAGGEVVSGDYFSTLGVKAAVGRTLGPDDDTPSALPAVVLSYAYWQTAFGGNPAAIGRSVLLNSVPFTIVGVAEPGFTRLSPGKTQDLFLSLSMLPRLNIPWGKDVRDPNNWWLVIVARLKPGVSLGQAQAAATLIFRNEMLHGAKALSKESDDPRIAPYSGSARAHRPAHIFLQAALRSDVRRRLRAFDCLRERCRLTACARYGPAERNGGSSGVGRGAPGNRAPTAYRKRDALAGRGRAGSAFGFLGRPRHDGIHSGQCGQSVSLCGGAGLARPCVYPCQFHFSPESFSASRRHSAARG